MKLRALCSCAALLVVLLLAVPASAGNISITGSGAIDSNDSPVYTPSTIFTNFGAGNTYNSGSGWTIGGSTSPVGLVMSAMDFTSTSGFTLSQIDVAIGWVTGFNGVTLSLETSSGGLPSNVVLDSWNLTGLPSFGSTGNTVETVFGADNLLANTQYWLVASATPGHSDTWAAWNLNSIGEVGNLAQNSGSGWTLFGGNSQGAFDVMSGSAGVPEPSSFLLLGTGLLGLLGAVRRKIR